jgi:hypothetical protein
LAIFNKFLYLAFASRNFAIWFAAAEGGGAAGRPVDGARPAAAVAAGREEVEEDGDSMASGSFGVSSVSILVVVEF